jgi:Leucine-rich repeat (LRR) protein
LDPGIFSDLPNLEELDLKWNKLIKLDKDLFKNLTALKELKLNFNKIAE